MVDLVDECTPPPSSDAEPSAAAASQHTTDMDDSPTPTATPSQTQPSQDALGPSDAELQLRAVLGDESLTAAQSRLLLRASGGDVAVSPGPRPAPSL